MADLIAQGTQPNHRWRRTLPLGKSVTVGRTGSGVYAVEWDDRISRRHVDLRWDGQRLTLQKVAGSRNPVFVQGQAVTEAVLVPDGHFVIGQTSFTLIEQRIDVTLQSPQPLRQQSFSPEYLQQMQYRNARTRVEMLGRLPEVISGATTQQELLVRLTGLLLSGIPLSDAVAMVKIDTPLPAAASVTVPPAIEVLYWDRRLLSSTSFEPSERLIREAISRRESVLHVWGGDSEARFTVRENIDWAFCTPVMGDACRGWAIYVTGRFQSTVGEDSGTDPNDLRDDLKFTEVAAATLRSLQELRLLQRQHAVQGQFFSPIVLEALAGEDWERALAPREAEVTVLFCDLRGFSLESEKSAGDLLGLLGRVSKALGVTTHHMLLEGGVVGDFQGDAVMGFWGWPIATTDAIAKACAAALAIRTELVHAAGQAGDPLAGFRLGIGLATGRAVAGKIGTVDQVKVTVFGPVVNLASRLESMTKTLRAPILLDETTARYVREKMPRTLARARRLAVVQPLGINQKVEVSELLPPESEYPELSDTNIAQYESALDAFLAGDWSTAFSLLHGVPASDRAKDFLTVYIAQHNRAAPEGWQGVIKLETK